MQLFVDEFSGERNRIRHIDFEMSAEEQNTLVEDENFTFCAPLKASVDVERVGTSFRLHVRFESEASFRCGRCNEMKKITVAGEDDWVYMLRSEFDTKYSDEEVELVEEDLDVSFYEGEVLDLDPIIREAIILELPYYARCEEGDPECDEAFERYIGPEGVRAQEDGKVNLRWAALKNVKVEKD